MSPIIYTPHDCEKPGNCAPRGTLWQCSECGLIWELDADTMATGERLKWWAIEGPRRDIALGAARARAVQPEISTTPTVTPHMVQLVLDTYAEHEGFVIQDGRVFCAECDAPLTNGTPSLVSHARGKAAEALQDALDKAGRDATE